MSKQEGESLLQTLVDASRDENLGMSRHSNLPFVQDETAQSHLFRIMDLWNVEMWDDTATNTVGKEVILTLLQCAARLYEDKTHAKAAVYLIESTHTRAILSLGIQNVLCQVAHQQYIGKKRSDKSEEGNAENHKRRVDLFSAIRKNKARQLNYQAMIFEHISSLCHSHGAALQNTFDMPRIDERFMFHNYVTLSKAFNRYEKSWLVTFLPDIFRWEGQDSYGGANGDGILAPNFGATKKANQDASSNASKVISPLPPATTPNIIGDVNMSCGKPVSRESVESLHGSLPWAPGELSPLITDGMASLSLGLASNKEWNKLLGVYGESRNGGSDSDFESFALTNKVLGIEKWMDLLRKRAINSPRSTSARIVTSPLDEPVEFYDQIMSQKEERRPIGIKIERKDAGNYHKEWKDRLLSPSSDIIDGDWNLLGSGDDSESIFRFSPDIHSDSANGKQLSTLLEDANNEHHGRISSAEDAQPSFPSVSTKNIHQQQTNMLEPGDWMRGYQNETRLPTVPGEPHEELEVEDRHIAHCLPNEALIEVKKPLEDDPGFGARCKRHNTRCVRAKSEPLLQSRFIQSRSSSS